MKGKGLILAYHRVNSSGKDPIAVTVENFQSQMKYFYDKGYTSLTLAEFFMRLAQDNMPRKTLVLTFDDGYCDNYLFAFPILKHYGFRGTIFLISEYIGTSRPFPMDMDKEWDEFTEEDLPLTWEQVLEMKEYGMEFGSHTCSHRHLDELQEKEMINEIVESKNLIEQKVKSQVKSFCYPSGRFNNQIKETVIKAGYSAAVVTPIKGQLQEDAYCLKRIGIYSNDHGWRFSFKISPYFRICRDYGLIYKLKNNIYLAAARP